MCSKHTLFQASHCRACQGAQLDKAPTTLEPIRALGCPQNPAPCLPTVMTAMAVFLIVLVSQILTSIIATVMLFYTNIVVVCASNA